MISGERKKAAALSLIRRLPRVRSADDTFPAGEELRALFAQDDETRLHLFKPLVQKS